MSKKKTHEPIRLTQSELITMLKSEQAVTLATKEHELQAAKMLMVRAQSERLLQEANDAVARAFAEAANAKVLHGKLAAELSKRYAFDWATHNFDDETGDVSPRSDD